MKFFFIISFQQEKNQALQITTVLVEREFLNKRLINYSEIINQQTFLMFENVCHSFSNVMCVYSDFKKSINFCNMCI